MYLDINPCHAEYFYGLIHLPILILLSLCLRKPHKGVRSQTVNKGAARALDKKCFY